MDQWKEIAIQSFPEHSTGPDAFHNPHMTIYQVFFRLREDTEKYIRTGNQAGLARIFDFVEWCFDQKDNEKDIWNAAATAFLEHLADSDASAAIIPEWVKPEIFQVMKSEFMKRRERDGTGKFKDLVEKYNRVNSTRFSE